MKKIQVKGKDAVIRRAIKSDAQELLDYLDIIGGESDFLTFGAEGLGITLEEEEAFIEGNMNQDNGLFIVVVLEGKIIGNLNFAGGVKQRTRHTGEFGVSVLKEFWGQGIGRELITYLIDWAKDTGIVTKINLKVRSDHEKGMKLYKSLGFIEEGIQTRDFLIEGKYYDSLIMGLELYN